MSYRLKSAALDLRIRTLLLVVGPSATLLVSPFSNFDPINLIKLLATTSIAMACLFLLLTTFNVERDGEFRALQFATVSFLGVMILSWLLNESNLSQSFWGVFGRNTGFLTYFSLIVVLYATATRGNLRFYRLLVDSLIMTSVPMTIYALLQLMGRDPIPWSEMAAFATLGNINFSSAFFGLSSLSATVLCFDLKSKRVRSILMLLAVIQIFIVIQTGSIQGVMIYGAGMVVAVFLWLQSKPGLRTVKVSYLIMSVTVLFATVASLFNLGPLAKFVFQNSILFRFDYWYAGWMMTLKNPLLGVGLDSYGDWYRELRGEVATLRTGPDRITNTAHNIYLDISASGGFPLLLAYGLMLFLALRASIIFMRRSKQFDGYFAALFSAWIAYLIQAAVSINQIGVGIWGWLFTGALIGYELATRVDVPEVHLTNKTFNKKVKSSGSSQIPASAALIGIAGFAIGFILSFIPLKADADFKKALQSGDLIAQLDAASSLGATAFHMELVLDASIKANNEELARQVTDQIIDRYPRDFMAWQVKQVLVSSSPREREEAYRRLKAMDPYNPKIQRIS